MSSESIALTAARLEWGADGQPRSTTHGDIYFSTADGLAESQHVFLRNSALAERWTQLEEGEDFVLGETGFGTGLNFLAAWEQWRAIAPPQARLHYLSVEAFPLGRSDLVRALSAFPDVSALAKELIAAWPSALARGLHRFHFDQGQVLLTLAFNEVLPGLESFLDSHRPGYRTPSRGVDGWFLDGFAPARNPDMWREEVLTTVAALSAPGATIATFTAAGSVRRGLQSAGFRVEKVPGFGRKREMLRGQLLKQADASVHSPSPPSPFPDGHPHAWSADRTNTAPAFAGRPDVRIAIVGAGLAGCHAATALSGRGFSVSLIDPEAALATGGSGNRQGVLYARPAPAGTAASRFNLAALLFAQRRYAPLWSSGDAGERCGVLHLAPNPSATAKQDALVQALHQPALCEILDQGSASEVAGVDLPSGGLWYPESGWLSPPAVCHWLLEGTPVDRIQARVTALEQNADGPWRLWCDEGDAVIEAEIVVLACAAGLDQFALTKALPVQPVRGQVSEIQFGKAGGQPSIPTPPIASLKVAICGNGYVTPPVNGRFAFGASFLPGDTGTDSREAETRENLDRLRGDLPGLLPESISAADCTNRAALRCATPDRLPLLGPVPDMAIMEERFALLRNNALAAISEPGAWHRGLYVSAGYGSRGLAYVPLATECLVAQICGEPPPLDLALREALNPARFLIRDLKRNRR